VPGDADHARYIAGCLRDWAYHLQERMPVAPDEELDETDESRFLITDDLRSAQGLLSPEHKLYPFVDRYCAKPYWKVRELPGLLGRVKNALCDSYGIDLDDPGRGGRASPLRAPTRSVVSRNILERPQESHGPER